jgi:hypothetical protein
VAFKKHQMMRVLHNSESKYQSGRFFLYSIPYDLYSCKRERIALQSKIKKMRKRKDAT